MGEREREILSYPPGAGHLLADINSLVNSKCNKPDANCFLV